MIQTSLRTIAMIVALTALPLLSACHTAAGVGQDISATGHAVTDTAHKIAN